MVSPSDERRWPKAVRRQVKSDGLSVCSAISFFIMCVFLRRNYKSLNKRDSLFLHIELVVTIENINWRISSK